MMAEAAEATTVPACCLPRFLEEAAPGLRMMSPPWIMDEAAPGLRMMSPPWIMDEAALVPAC